MLSPKKVLTLKRAVSQQSADVRVVKVDSAPTSSPPASQQKNETLSDNPEKHPDPPKHQEQMSSLDTNLDDLFVKLAKLNSSLHLEPPSSSPANSFQQNSKKAVKRAFSLSAKGQKLTEEANSVLSMQHFQMGNSLGEGKFGDVIQLFHKQTGMLFALKKLFKSTMQEYGMETQVLREVRCLQELCHPNIVKLYGGFTDEYHTFMIMEYIDGQTLDKFYCSDYSVVSRILAQVLRAVDYMHSKHIVHRDIKPQNLIYTYGVVKLCDFGWATSFEKAQPTQFCGTLDYVSPQVAQRLPYDGQVDMWCVGVLAFELLTGHVPFKDPSQQKHIQNIINCNLADILFPSWMPADAKDFIERLLVKNPRNRMTAAQALHHPFIQRYEVVEQIPNDIGDVVFKG